MLINCVAYQEGKKLNDITIEEISDYLLIPGCFVWVALLDAELPELEKMREEFELHPLAVEDAWNSHQHPKIEEYGDSLFAVMQLVKIDGDELTVGEVDVFVGVNYVLSVRYRSKDGFLGVRERCEREPHLLSHGAGFVFYALMDAVVDRYFPVVERLESELEDIEEQIFIKGSALSNIERLYELKRKVTTLKHAVAPLIEETEKLHRGRVPPVCAHNREYFRDVYDHLNRINTSIENIRETIGTAIQVNLSMVAIPARHYFSRKLKWGPIRFQQRKMTWRVCLRRPAFVPLQPKTQNIGFRLASYFDLARMT